MHKTYERIARAKMSLENKVHQIIDFFKAKKTVMFSEMIEGDDSPFNRVITFLSVLELLKQHSLRAEQPKRFGDIKVEKIDSSEEIVVNENIEEDFA